VSSECNSPLEWSLLSKKTINGSASPNSKALSKDKAPIADAESTSVTAASKEPSPEPLNTTAVSTLPKLEVTTQNKNVEGNQEDIANEEDVESGEIKSGLCCPWFGDTSKKKEKKSKKGIKNNDKALWKLERNGVDGKDSKDPVSDNNN